MTMRTHRKKWLCVAYAFPPINRSGTHRTAAFVRHLTKMGWDAEVLTVEPRGEPVDFALLEHIPPTTRVHRTRWVELVEFAKGARGPSKSKAVGTDPTNEPVSRVAQRSWRDWGSRLLKTPDSRLGWVPFGVARGVQCIRRSRPDILYSTSPYASAHLIAWTLHHIFRIPWVADFRDPWISNPYATTDYLSLNRWNGCLERLVVQSASTIVCNTGTLRGSLCRRYPNVEAKCVVIPNGVDLDLFATIPTKRTSPRDEFQLLHAGQFYGPRRPHELFEALRSARERLAMGGLRPHLTLLGGETHDGTSLRTLAEHAGVGEAVSIVGQRSHAETLALLQEADALVMVGSSGAGAELQVPNKLYEYMGARRPILAAMPADSPALRMLVDAAAPSVTCDPASASAIADAIVQIARGEYNHPPEPWRGVDRFDRVRRAAALCGVFDSLTGKGQGSLLGSATATTNHVGHRDSFAARARWSSPDHDRTAPAFRPAGS